MFIGCACIVFGLVGVEYAVKLLQLVGFQFKLLVMPGLKPNYHRFLVAFLEHILIVPLAVGFIDVTWLRFLLEGLFEIAQFEAIVIKATILDHTEDVGLVEGVEGALVGLLIHEVEGNAIIRMAVEVENCDLI